VHAGVDAPVAFEPAAAAAMPRAAPTAARAAPEIEPIWSARKNALTPSPACLPMIPTSSRIASSIAAFSRLTSSK
jgi:hypothetical protein